VPHCRHAGQICEYDGSVVLVLYCSLTLCLFCYSTPTHNPPLPTTALQALAFGGGQSQAFSPAIGNAVSRGGCGAVGNAIASGWLNLRPSQRAAAEAEHLPTM
jgi:hypothetical protein